MSNVISCTKMEDKENILGKILSKIVLAAFILTVFGVELGVSSVASAEDYKRTSLGSNSSDLSTLHPKKCRHCYLRKNLVSNRPDMVPVTIDTNLKNPWGIAHSITGPWVVANNHTGVATVYDGNGQPFPNGSPLIVNINSASGNNGPVTGVVFNSTPDFKIGTGIPAVFIFVTEDGSISAWNPAVDSGNAILKVNNPNAIYKGVTIANNGNTNLLYVANFHEGSVDVFDTNFNKVTLDPDKSVFVDKKIPDGYGPFNVQNIDGKIYVAFAEQDAGKADEVPGPGHGFVSVFSTEGKFLQRLKHNRFLNAPWAIDRAPSDFGKFSNFLLVGNFGSGRIAAYDTEHGNFKGLLRNRRGKPIVSEGLWGLGFGNGGIGGPVNTLFFAAGINDESDGVFGTLTPISK